MARQQQHWQECMKQQQQQQAADNLNPDTEEGNINKPVMVAEIIKTLLSKYILQTLRLASTKLFTNFY